MQENANRRNLKKHIYSVQNIRKGNVEKAVELLEIGIDGGLIAMKTDGKFTGRTNHTVNKAIKLSRSYRSNYPGKNFPDINEEVARALSGGKGEYHGQTRIDLDCMGLLVLSMCFKFT